MSGAGTIRTHRPWTAVVAAPAAWIVAGLAGYVLVARSCEPGRNGLSAYGVHDPAAVLVGLAVVALLCATYGLVVALGSWRAARAAGVEGERTHRAETGTARFIAVAGILTSALFVGGIALFGIPAFLLQVCSQAH